MGFINYFRVNKKAADFVSYIGDKNIEDFLNDGGEEYIKYLIIAEEYIKSIKSRSNFGNPECWFNAFPHDNYFYIIPEFPNGLNLFVSENSYPDYVEDYRYWDNVDPSDEVDEDEFYAREEV